VCSLCPGSATERGRSGRGACWTTPGMPSYRQGMLGLKNRSGSSSAKATTLMAVCIGLLALLVGGGRWLRSCRTDPVRGTVLQPHTAQVQERAARPAPSANAIETASLTVGVSDDRGPLRGATVRFAPSVGEIVVVTTGADGVAQAAPLEPGRWWVSAS